MEICTGRESAVFGYIVYIEIYHLILREKLSRHLYIYLAIICILKNMSQKHIKWCFGNTCTVSEIEQILITDFFRTCTCIFIKITV